MQGIALRIQHGIEQSAVRVAALQHALAEGSYGLFFRQT